MRVDPRFQVEVTHVNRQPIGSAVAPAVPTPGPTLPADHSRITRGFRTTLQFSQTKLTRPLNPQAETDRLNFSEAWSKARGKFRDPDLDTLGQAETELASFLAELDARGLQNHPQYQQLSRLRDSLRRLAEREESRSAPKSESTGLLAEMDEAWNQLLGVVLGPGHHRQRLQRLLQDGATLAAGGRPEGAIKAFQRALMLDPDHAEANARLGKLLLEARRYPEAEAHLQRAATYRPRDFDLHVSLGELYYHLGENQLSQQAFGQAMILNSRHSDPHAWLGILAYEDNRMPEAARSLEHAVALDPANAVARFYLAQLAYQLNDPLRANYQLQMVNRLEPLTDLQRFAADTPALPAGNTDPQLEAHRWVPPR